MTNWCHVLRVGLGNLRSARQLPEGLDPGLAVLCNGVPVYEEDGTNHDAQREGPT